VQVVAVNTLEVAVNRHLVGLLILKDIHSRLNHKQELLVAYQLAKP
jgi:hypothetical protein